jgi:PKD repeat protein
VLTYLWDFGDGRTSDSQSVDHTYVRPGSYYGSVTITDQFGNQWTESFTVVVYTTVEEEVSEYTPLIANKCYRLAIKKNQGVGIVEWGIGGDWPFCEAYAGCVKGYDSSNQGVSLIIDRREGRFFRLGDFWRDKIGSYGQGIEINNMVRIREHIGDSEEDMLEHIESRVGMRPYDEDNKGQSGYTDAGFLENHRVELKMFSDGDTDTPVAKLKSVQQYGDYVFGKRIEAKRIQLQAEMSTAAYRIPFFKQLIQTINKITPDEVGGIRTESLYQRMFRGQDLWITRDSVTPLKNRATGNEATGDYNTLVSGPDGKAYSAIALVNGSNIGLTLSQLSLPCTLNFWVGDLIGNGITLSFDLFEIEIIKSGTVSVTLGHMAWSESVALEWDGTGWVMITLSSDGVDFFVYENGVLKGIVTPTISNYGGAFNITGNNIASIYDIRRVPRQIGPEALQWYYDDVVNGEGDGGLLPIMR